MSRLDVLGVMALVGLLVVGCTRVPAPTSRDTTAPTIRWRFENLTTGSDIDIKGSAGIAARQGQTVRLWLFADDPQGVKEIRLSGNVDFDCRWTPGPDGSVSSMPPGFIAPQKQTLSPDADNTVLTSIFLLHTEDLRLGDCPDGGRSGTPVFSFTGQAWNYSNKSGTGGIAIYVGH